MASLVSWMYEWSVFSLLLNIIVLIWSLSLPPNEAVIKESFPLFNDLFLYSWSKVLSTPAELFFYQVSHDSVRICECKLCHHCCTFYCLYILLSNLKICSSNTRRVNFVMKLVLSRTFISPLYFSASRIKTWGILV